MRKKISNYALIYFRCIGITGFFDTSLRSDLCLLSNIIQYVVRERNYYCDHDAGDGSGS